MKNFSMFNIKAWLKRQASIPVVVNWYNKDTNIHLMSRHFLLFPIDCSLIYDDKRLPASSLLNNDATELYRRTLVYSTPHGKLTIEADISENDVISEYECQLIIAYGTRTTLKKLFILGCKLWC